jgi:hypothetical protein
VGRVQGSRLPGIGSHHSARSLTDEWLTPPDLLGRLGPFDLDPCSPLGRPWDTAAAHLTVADDGLSAPWHGRVWLNPPYSEVDPWMERMARHGRGTALLFGRTDTRCWARHIWPHVSAVLFLFGRLTFYRGDGTASKAGHNSGGPSVLLAYGPDDADRLARSGIAGAFTSTITVLPGL